MAKPKYLAGRSAVLQALREELIGPAPAGEELDFSRPVAFTNSKEAYGPFWQKGTGEEVLLRNGPSRRYGIGILYPFRSEAKANEDLGEAGEAGVGRLGATDTEEEDGTPQTVKAGDPSGPRKARIQNVASKSMAAEEANDEALALANTYRPSSMAVSFLAELPPGAKLLLRANGGRYNPVKVSVEEMERTWWLRSQAVLETEVSSTELHQQVHCKGTRRNAANIDGITLDFEALSRRHGKNPQQRLLTVALVNRTPNNQSADRYGLFQTTFEARIVSPDGSWHILPYPRAAEMGIRDDVLEKDEEESSIALLYRNTATFADWPWLRRRLGSRPRRNRARSVTADPLPVFETPSVTPDVKDSKGNEITVSMAALADLTPNDDGFGSLEQIISLYEQWIAARELEIVDLESQYQPAARRHISACQVAVGRMRAGLAYLRSDPLALKAFRLANYAILAQQARSRSESRRATFDPQSQQFVFDEAYPEPDLLHLGTGRGNWRAFQIAFLLMTLESSANGESPDREIVELIWFPTGGGKTEAYLGLAAFAIFMRRLRDPKDTGVHVLMRYTLRLLTTQQFQRAARLICAMEFLRQQEPETLGETSFSIGMWVGGSSTPNNRENAVSALNALRNSNRRKSSRIPLPLTSAPGAVRKWGHYLARANLAGVGANHPSPVMICRIRPSSLFAKTKPVPFPPPVGSLYM